MDRVGSVRTNFFKPVFQHLLDDPDDYLEQIRSDAEGFSDRLLREAEELSPPLGAIPALASIALFVFQPNGVVLQQTVPPGWPSNVAFEDFYEQLPEVGAGYRIIFLRLRNGMELRAICFPYREVQALNLPYSVREALLENPDSRLLMCANAFAGSLLLDSKSNSYGLTSLQQRSIYAVSLYGSARDASKVLGLSYATVRESLSLAARKVGAPNLPALVRRVLESQFGILPEQLDSASELSAWLPLSARQCQICELIAEGVSRQATAKAMRISPAVVKKEMESIFSILEVRSAAALARIWVEAQALRLFARATEGSLGFFDPAVEPTRYLPREDDHQIIAWSDYGPTSGKPVLLIHSNWTCRAVPREMVMRLQAAGWRPIAIDRPGFGKTHPGTLSIGDPYTQGVKDTIAVLDRLKIRTAAVITRRAGQFTTVLKQALGDRIGPILLTSPSPPTTASGIRKGIVGVVKEAFYRSPQLVEFFFRFVSAQFTLPRMEKLTRGICKGSPPDELLCDDPQFIRDRFRAIRPFSTGNLEGAVIEEMQVSRNLFRLEPLRATKIMIVHGRHDNHYSYEEVCNYWSRMWPEAEIREVEDGGQFLTSSHPALLVDLLEMLAESP